MFQHITLGYRRNGAFHGGIDGSRGSDGKGGICSGNVDRCGAGCSVAG